jgi:adenylate cyclase class IV
LERIETELKVMGVDPEAFARALESMGIEAEQEDQDDLVVLLGRGDVMRVRRVGGKVRVTHKRLVRQGDFKVARETELEVSSFESAANVVKRMCRGHKCYRFRKERKVFRLDGVKGELVHLDPLPWYVELEGEEDRIVRAMELLGLQEHDTSSECLPQLLRRSGIMPEDL